MRNQTALSLTALSFLLLFPTSVGATDYQLCDLGSTCEVGEFLYDDDYSIYTGATCTLDAKDPDGNTFLSGQSMTEAADGWYSYSFDTTGEDEGLYRATICCTAGTDYLCLDKSWEIKTSTTAPTAGEVANAVLDANLEDHDNSGTIGDALNNISGIPGSVWAYSTRSLSTFGTLISDFWNSSDNTSNSSSTTNNTTVNNSYQDILNQISDNRLAIEALLNEPIIENFLDEGTPPDVKKKIATTRDYVNSLYSSVQSNKARLVALNSGWNRLGKAELTRELESVIDAFGTNSQDPSEDSILAYTAWLEDAWGNPVTTEANNLALATLATLETTFDQVDYLGGNASSRLTLEDALDTLSELEDVVGTVASDEEDPTLFGHLRRVQRRAQVLDEHDTALRSIQADLGEMSQGELSQALTTQETSLLAINEFDNPFEILENQATDAKRALKNKLYSLQALLDLNKALLAYNTSDLIGHTWVTEGSVIFRSVITNPSKLITQTAKLDYTLPQELEEDDILDLDPDLETSYDYDTNRLKVLGSFELAPEESVVVWLEAEDVWIVSDEDLANYRQLANDLTESLKKTALYGQATSIKGDIEIILDNIASEQDDSGTPLERIKRFRQLQLQLLDVEEKLATLKDLVNQADTARSLTGFVGGSTALLAWGLITIILAGFGFLALYIKKNSLEKKKKSRIVELGNNAPADKSVSPSLSPVSKPRTTASLEDRRRPFPWLPVSLGAAALIIIALVASFFLSRRQPALQAPVEIEDVTPTSTPAPDSTLNQATNGTPPSGADNQAEQDEDSDKVVLGQTPTLQETLIIEDGSSVNLRTGPGTDFDIALALRTTTDLYIFGHDEDEEGRSWTHVGLSEGDAPKDYYLLSELLEE